MNAFLKSQDFICRRTGFTNRNQGPHKTSDKGDNCKKTSTYLLVYDENFAFWMPSVIGHTKYPPIRMQAKLKMCSVRRVSSTWLDRLTSWMKWKTTLRTGWGARNDHAAHAVSLAVFHTSIQPETIQKRIAELAAAQQSSVILRLVLEESSSELRLLVSHLFARSFLIAGSNVGRSRTCHCCTTHTVLNYEK